jgi:hypothetical protein
MAAKKRPITLRTLAENSVTELDRMAAELIGREKAERALKPTRWAKSFSASGKATAPKIRSSYRD